MADAAQPLSTDALPDSDLPGPYPVGTYAAQLRLRLRELAHVQLVGEVWGVRAGRARVYFELRDARGALPCSMWQTDFDGLGITLSDGMRVLAGGGCDFYPGSSTSSPAFSFAVSELRIAGEGDLLAALERLRRRLAADGLFEPQKQLRRPQLPRTIGVVTGERGKARDDVLACSRRPAGSSATVAARSWSGPGRSPISPARPANTWRDTVGGCTSSSASSVPLQSAPVMRDARWPRSTYWCCAAARSAPGARIACAEARSSSDLRLHWPRTIRSAPSLAGTPSSRTATGSSCRPPRRHARRQSCGCGSATVSFRPPSHRTSNDRGAQLRVGGRADRGDHSPAGLGRGRSARDARPRQGRAWPRRVLCERARSGVQRVGGAPAGGAGGAARGSGGGAVSTFDVLADLPI